MKHKLFITTLLIFSTLDIFSNDLPPGWYDGGSGVDDETPAAPIDNWILPMLIFGMILIFVLYKNSKILKKN